MAGSTTVGGPDSDGPDTRTEQARRRLAQPDYRPLWDAARRRLERNGVRLEGGPVTVGGLSAEGRVAVCGLLGRSAAGTKPVRVRLTDLDAALRHGAANCGLVDLLGALGPPVRDRAGERAQRERDRDDAWARVLDHPTVAARRELVGWVEAVRRHGTAARLARGTSSATEPTGDDEAALMAAALDVLARLPAPGIPLAHLAATVTGDAHGLDRGQPLGTLVAGALEWLATSPAPGTVAVDEPDPADPGSGDDAVADDEPDLADPGSGDDAVADDEPDPPGRADPGDGERAQADPQGVSPNAAGAWRRLWAGAGVVCDDLSVSVLVLNLPVTGGDDLVGTTVARHRAAGEPLRLTLRQLTGARLEVAPGSVVHVCENPSVVAGAALQLGAGAAPLVCTDGQPDTAVHELLALLTGAGAVLRYHGDFDWGGLRIARLVMDQHGATAWRFGADDYRRTVGHGAGPPPRVASATALGAPPTGVASPWDPELVEAMTAVGVAVHEEQVLEALLADLADVGARTTS